MVRQARLTGFEPATVWFVVKCSIQLSYKRSIYKQPSGINFVSSIQCLYHNLSCTQTHCHPFHPFDQKDCSIVVLAVRNLPHLHSIAISPTIPSASFIDAFWLKVVVSVVVVFFEQASQPVCVPNFLWYHVPATGRYSRDSVLKHFIFLRLLYPMELPTRFELVFRVLQTHALPLG